VNVAVIGAGRVGLVTGAGFAEFGHHVTCADVDGSRIAQLRRGEVPFFEPGLPELVKRNVLQGRLAFTTDTAAPVSAAQLVLLAVGTPSLADGDADLSPLRAAVEQVGRALAPAFTVVAIKSTVPVGTAELVREIIARNTTHPFAVASNPEFLKEGDAVNDFMKPARVIIGADDPRAIERLREVYYGVMRTGERIHVMDARSAELTKYAANAMLATRISFMNELALLADKLGADVEHVRKAIGADPRIGTKFLFPGIGFGGSCFPKDLRALRQMGRRADARLGVVEAVIAANENQKQAFADRVIAAFDPAPAAGKRAAIWGLAFKPETDDVREAPSLDLIARLRRHGVIVAAYDPIAADNVRALLGDDIIYAANPYAAAEGADAVVLVTEWHELRRPDFARLRSVVRTPVLFDGRNVWPPEEARRAGFTYHGVGHR
jgi:UDPglucose 6-dehydrogenase